MNRSFIFFNFLNSFAFEENLPCAIPKKYRIRLAANPSCSFRVFSFFFLSVSICADIERRQPLFIHYLPIKMLSIFYSALQCMMIIKIWINSFDLISTSGDACLYTHTHTHTALVLVYSRGKAYLSTNFKYIIYIVYYVVLSPFTRNLPSRVTAASTCTSTKWIMYII